MRPHFLKAQTKERVKSGYFFLLIFGVQAVIFCIFDPLSYPDTIRYLNFADFLQHPQISHFGDLAYNSGILFTPLFLPYFLVFFKKVASFPYVLSGTILQFISFQAILWLAYAIALRIDGKKTARLALALLLTNLVFCFHSAFILTEYPFTAVLLLIIFYAVKNKAMSSRNVFILSLLFGILVSMRIQGVIFTVIIALYLLFLKRMRPGQLSILCAIPLAYFLFYIYFYRYLNSKFPSTITMNEIFSLNSFFLGDNFARYNFFVHGVDALVTKKISPHILYNITLYAGLIKVRIFEFIRLINAETGYHYLFFIVLTCIAFIFSKIREKSLIIFLILFNLVATILFLAPAHAVLRYQEGLFPLAIILIASCFVHRNEGIARKNGIRTCIFLFMLFLYAAYFVMCHYDLFRSVMLRKHDRIMILRKESVNSAELIANEIGRGHDVIVSDPVYYNLVYRSGNIPVYFFDGWEAQAISDYIYIRNIRYLIAPNEVINRLKEKGIEVRIKRPISEISNPDDRIFVCEF